MAADGATVNEAAVVLRALRDFNMPKITAADMPSFQALLKDLFPDVTADSGLSSEQREQFEVRPLLFITHVRHCAAACCFHHHVVVLRHAGFHVPCVRSYAKPWGFRYGCLRWCVVYCVNDFG